MADLVKAFEGAEYSDQGERGEGEKRRGKGKKKKEKGGGRLISSR